MCREKINSECRPNCRLIGAAITLGREPCGAFSADIGFARPGCSPLEENEKPGAAYR